jgi:ABC-type amino acid transport system permease subunit
LDIFFIIHYNWRSFKEEGKMIYLVGIIFGVFCGIMAAVSYVDPRDVLSVRTAVIIGVAIVVDSMVFGYFVLLEYNKHNPGFVWWKPMLVNLAVLIASALAVALLRP